MRKLVLMAWRRHRRRKPECSICAMLKAKGMDVGPEAIPARQEGSK